MKKAIAIIMIMIVFTSLLFTAGCGRLKIPDEAAPYYAEAIASLLWCKGNSASIERIGRPEIKVIEEDSFGRVMFEYSEGWANVGLFKTGAIYDYLLCAVLIAQKCDEEFVYYYPDVNFKCRKLVKNDRYALPTELTENELTELKQLNDWDKEIDLSRCTKAANKYEIVHRSILDSEQIQAIGKELENRYGITLCVLPMLQNRSGSVLVSAMEYYSPWDGHLFMFIVDKDGAYVLKDNSVDDFDYYDYQNVLMELKIECDWE